MPHEEHWYEVVRGPALRQGDIFRDLTAYTLPPDVPNVPDDLAEATVNVPAGWTRSTWIVLDASCDIAVNPPKTRPTCSNVLLARVIPVDDAVANLPAGERPTTLEVIRRGYWPSRFLLSGFGAIAPAFPLSIVEWPHRVFMPHAYLVRNGDVDRLRLKPPFREAFGQWVGSCVSRVGPENETLIPRQNNNVFPAQILRANDRD